MNDIKLFVHCPQCNKLVDKKELIEIDFEMEDGKKSPIQKMCLECYGKLSGQEINLII